MRTSSRRIVFEYGNIGDRERAQQKRSLFREKILHIVLYGITEEKSFLWIIQ